MSTYHAIWWLPLAGGLTGLGLVLSWLAMRRRGLRAGLRGAAWSLLPLAAYLTGSIEMFWKMGVAIGDFAKGFAFSPRVWSGIAVAGLSVVLFVGSGGLRRRRRVKQGKDAGGVPGRAAGSVTGATGSTMAIPASTAPAGTAPAGTAGVPAAAPEKLPRRRAKAAAAGDSGDDDMRDVEEILRRRGIS
jgi:hypothetical protein